MFLLYKSEADESGLKPQKDFLRLLVSSRTTLSEEGLSLQGVHSLPENDGPVPLVSG